MIAIPEPVETPAGNPALITELPAAAEAIPAAAANDHILDGEVRDEIRSILSRALSRSMTTAQTAPPLEAEDNHSATAVVEESCEPEPAPFYEPAKPVEIDADVLSLLEQDSAPAAHRSFADLWNAMDGPAVPSKARAARKTAPAPQMKLELIHGAGVPVSSLHADLPPGMNDDTALRSAMAAGKRFTGFAVCVGANDNDGRSCDPDLLRSISAFIGSLLRDNEFGCRASNDEFLILCPNRHGAEAQLRLTAISEQLWDYQLRNSGRFSLCFTWGSAEARHEALADAVAGAKERMYETRRTRRVISVDMLRTQPHAAAM